MKIAIRADGSPQIGMGHIMRCSAFASAAVGLSHDVCFFTNAEAAGYLLSKNMDVVTRFKSFITAAREYKADCVLIDSYTWPAHCYALCAEHFYTAVIDDYVRLPYSAHMLINANLYAPALDYSKSNVNTFLLGGRYVLLRGEFKNVTPARFNRRVKRVLVTMGGADVNGYTPVVLEGLADIAGMEVIVVVGSMSRCGDEIGRAAKHCNSKVEIIYSPDNMAEVINSCDIAVSAAGTTIYELCAMGIPSVIINQADNQNMICDYLNKTGYMKVLGDYRTVRPNDIQKAVTYLIANPDERASIKKQLLTLVDLNGAENIINAIEAGMKEIR